MALGDFFKGPEHKANAERLEAELQTQRQQFEEKIQALQQKSQDEIQALNAKYSDLEAKTRQNGTLDLVEIHVLSPFQKKLRNLAGRQFSCYLGNQFLV